MIITRRSRRGSAMPSSSGAATTDLSAPLISRRRASRSRCSSAPRGRRRRRHRGVHPGVPQFGRLLHRIAAEPKVIRRPGPTRTDCASSSARSRTSCHWTDGRYLWSAAAGPSARSRSSRPGMPGVWTTRQAPGGGRGRTARPGARDAAECGRAAGWPPPRRAAAGGALGSRLSALDMSCAASC